MPNIQLCTPLTLDQLRILQPDIVICAGTRSSVNEQILKNERLVVPFKSLKHDGTIYVSAYHTAQSRITHKEYYRRIINAIGTLG